MAKPALTLVTRVDCALCEEVADELRRLEVPFDSLDVDADPELVLLYDECVPVLLSGDEELGRAPFTPASLRTALRRAGALK
jgi:hypothetical protein